MTRRKKSKSSKPKQDKRALATKKVEPEQPVVLEQERSVVSAQKRGLPIVGVGSSAGGLNALQSLFTAMPEQCGMAFIVVTHQKSGRISMLPDLIANATSLSVCTATNNTKPEENHVYVGAPGERIEVRDGRMVCIEDDAEELHYRLIDNFLTTLAEDQGQEAIGIILSGAGNDGTVGAKAIKEQGGFLLVQDEESAKYTAMPLSANSTGLADYTLSPKKMPGILLSQLKRPLAVFPEILSESEINEKDIDKILRCLHAKTRHHFTGYKRSTMRRRIERRMHVHKIARADNYLEFLQDNTSEPQQLMNELLISVTQFFRDPHAFDALIEQVITPLIEKRKEGEAIRVWVPGCATGEEAYTIALLFYEQMQKANRRFDVQIFSTDIDEQAINYARRGTYPESIVENLTEKRLKNYFVHENNIYRIRKDIREMVVFAVQNVIHDPPFTKLDLISCRNVMIYLGSNVQRRLIPLFHYALRDQGVLFLGSAESGGRFDDLYEIVDRKSNILRRKAAIATLPSMDLTLSSQTHEEPQVKGNMNTVIPASTPNTTIAHIQRFISTRFAPTCFVLDSHGTLIYIQGSTTDYLEVPEGEPSQNAIRMARKGLGPVLAESIREANEKKAEVIRDKVRVQTSRGVSQISVSVSPISNPKALEGFFLVSLRSATDEVPTPTSGKAVAELPSESFSTQGEEDLERELQYTRESLQGAIEELETTNEELKSSNEELQSTNEELQSTNEELETAKEETQSLNEELNTVNCELQAKVDALSQVNDDMKNLLNSTQVASVFLNQDLNVKRFTDKAKTLIHLIESDIGRPLGDLAFNLDYPDLMDNCQEVLRTLIPQEKEVISNDKLWYQVRVMPYRTSENMIDGIVITMIEITRAKEAEMKASSASSFCESIIQTVPAPLIILDTNFRIIEVNESFAAILSTQVDKLMGVNFYNIDQGEWDIPQFRELFESTLPEEGSTMNHMIEHKFPRIGQKRFVVNAQRIDRTPGQLGKIILSLTENIQRS